MASVISINGNTNTTIDTAALVAALRNCNKTDVYDVLASFGIEYASRKHGEYEAVDNAILEILGKHADGLNSKALKFFLVQSGCEDITPTQFHSRLQSLQKGGKVVLNKELGTYGVTGA